MLGESGVAFVLWCRRQNGNERVVVHQVACREEESFCTFCTLIGLMRYDADH